MSRYEKYMSKVAWLNFARDNCIREGDQRMANMWAIKAHEITWKAMQLTIAEASEIVLG